MMINMNNEFINWINRELEERGWSQQELSRRAGLSQSAISMVLNGREPGWDFCEKIAGPLGKSTRAVMELAGKLERPPSVGDPHLDNLLDIAQNLDENRLQQTLNFARFMWKQQADEEIEKKKAYREAEAAIELYELIESLTDAQRFMILEYFERQAQLVTDEGAGLDPKKSNLLSSQ